jgi:hypothetical protein
MFTRKSKSLTKLVLGFTFAAAGMSAQADDIVDDVPPSSVALGFRVRG